MVNMTIICCKQLMLSLNCCLLRLVTFRILTTYKPTCIIADHLMSALPHISYF